MKLLSKALPILLLLTVTCSGCETLERTITIGSTAQPTATIQIKPSAMPTLPIETNKGNVPSQETFVPSTTPTVMPTCLKLKDGGILSQDLSKGRLLLYDRQDGKVFKSDLASGELSELSDAQWDAVYASPDKKSFSYLVKVEGKDYQLAYYLFSAQGIRTIPLEKSIYGEWPLLSGWINNNTVAFQVFGNQPTTLITIDLVTSQTNTLVPEFPDIDQLDPWSWSNWGRTIYSPDFRYVVYPRLKNPEPYRYILWDMQEQKEVDFIDAGHASYAPQWAPDGKKFAVAVLNSDFFMMNVDGTIARLTNLHSEFPSYKSKIRSWSWSPDSQRIAFWLDLYFNEELVEERLMVFDNRSSGLMDYCRYGDQIQISPGTLDYTPAPIWSPDGTALLIENREEENKSQLIVIDLNQHSATQIGENLYPYGWLLK